MNIKLMKNLCKADQSFLLKFLTKYLINWHYKIIKSSDDYILAEGTIPICLVAHLDTVGAKPPTEIYYDSEQHTMWSPQLLGADDRAGVYAIMQIIEAGYRPHIIFTTNEEVGAIGAKALVNQYPNCPLDNLKAIFELDRQGRNDCVFYSCNNRDFETYVSSFGFDKNYGSFSDISVLGPAWGIAAANLSCGYYNEHENIELLRMNELHETIDRVKNILDKAESADVFKYIPAPVLQTAPWNFLDGKTRCDFCERRVKKVVSIYEKELDMYFKICKSCFRKYYGGEA